MKAVVLGLLLIGPAVPAQTFVVDAANGTGTNYTSLAAAVTAVPDGATLIVRAGSYAGFSVAQKGLTILADPGVAVTDVVAFSNTLPGQSITVRRLT